jgi:hypothetical protein
MGMGDELAMDRITSSSKVSLNTAGWSSSHSSCGGGGNVLDGWKSTYKTTMPTMPNTGEFANKYNNSINPKIINGTIPIFRTECGIRTSSKMTAHIKIRITPCKISIVYMNIFKIEELLNKKEEASCILEI